MKYFKNLIFGLLAVLTSSQLILLAGLFLIPPPDFTIEPARPKFWSYPALSEASYHYKTLDDGRIQIHLEHPLVRNVTPEMISWWYQNLSIGEVNIDGINYPYYQIFHLSEHGQTNIKHAATDGSPGMGAGAIVYRQETFGPFKSRGQGRIQRFDDFGYVAIPVTGPLELGKIEHSFKPVSGGTLYTVDAVLGSQIPYYGWAINYYIRNKQFSEPAIKEWLRHQVEEVGSLPHYLPKIYTANTQP